MMDNAGLPDPMAYQNGLQAALEEEERRSSVSKRPTFSPMAKPYLDFLSSKRAIQIPVGIERDDDYISRLVPAAFDYQRKIIKWSLSRARCANFAAPGLGKTLMKLAWAHEVHKHTGGDVFVLAPLAVVEQTRREGDRFGFEINPVKGPLAWKPGVNITNYDRLDSFPESLIRNCAGIALDESGILKNFEGKFRVQVTEVAKPIPFRLCATATPAPNDFMELGTHSEFLGYMTRAEMLATFFVHDGGKTSQWRLKGHAQDIFWDWVCTWAVCVRKPSDLGGSDVGFELPPLNIVHSEIEAVPQKGMLFAEAANTLPERRAARKESLPERAALAAERIAAAPDRPWVIWCGLNTEADAAKEAIAVAVEVRGNDTPDSKVTKLTGFVEEKIRVLITKPKIAGFGMNWQHCSDMIFLGLSDSYEEMYQAIRRCWRFGQKRPVNVHIITSALEAMVVKNVERKEKDHEILQEAMTAAVRRAWKIGATQVEEAVMDGGTVSGEDYAITHGDCVEGVRTLEDNSIGFSVFSPPFASLYTYSDSPRDMGNCGDYAEFRRHFQFLVIELLRVMQPGRCVAIHCMNLPTHLWKDGEIGLRDFRGDIIRIFAETECTTCAAENAKRLGMMDDPVACLHGFIYHSEVCIWKDPVTAMQRTKALGLLHKQVKKDSCKSRQGIADYVVVMRKPGENPNPVSHAEDLPVEAWQKLASPVWMDINPSRTLQYTTAREEQDEKHICPLQLDVIERCLRLWSNPGDLVLSPFTGIGSEGYCALKEGRRFRGFELKRSYFNHACKNLEAALLERKQTNLFEVR